MMEKKNPPREASDALSAASTQISISPLPLDVDKYRPFLDEFELTEAQQRELLETLWTMMKTFVELGFGVDPVQQVLSAAILSAAESTASDLESSNRAVGVDGRPTRKSNSHDRA